MFNLEDAYYIARKLNINFCDFTIEEFLTGLNIELEHGKVNEATNVTNNDLEATVK